MTSCGDSRGSGGNVYLSTAVSAILARFVEWARRTGGPPGYPVRSVCERAPCVRAARVQGRDGAERSELALDIFAAAVARRGVKCLISAVGHRPLPQ